MSKRCLNELIFDMASRGRRNKMSGNSNAPFTMAENNYRWHLYEKDPHLKQGPHLEPEWRPQDVDKRHLLQSLTGNLTRMFVCTTKVASEFWRSLTRNT